jgi:dCTP diphosphatase
MKSVSGLLQAPPIGSKVRSSHSFIMSVVAEVPFLGDAALPSAAFPFRGCRGTQASYVAAMDQLRDDEVRVAELKERVLAFARERDWEQFHSPKNLSMALAAEAGELLENFLWVSTDDSRATARDPKRREAIEHEIADIVIYALQFANQTGIDLASAIEAKMAHNARKYPVEKSRGRSAKYTEL